MNKIMAFIIALVFAVPLTLVAGFVIASIQGYDFNFAAAIPFGLILGIIFYFFSHAVPTEPR